MNYLKVLLIGIVSLLVSSFTTESDSILSTGSALVKYKDLIKGHTYLIYPELRENPIKWFDSIPERKIQEEIKLSAFTMTAQPGEYFVYQLGVWALQSDLDDIRVEFSDLKNNRTGKKIEVVKMTCFNTGGIDFMGKPFTKTVNVRGGRIQALWMGLDLEGIAKGIYSGSVSVIAGNEKQTLPIQLTIAGEIVPNHGYNEGYRLSRLNWLNSTTGINGEVTKGYPPAQLDKNTVSILGRSLSIAENGLPASITSFFSPSNQTILDKGEPVVPTPFRFLIVKEDGKIIPLKPGELEFTEITPSRITWKVQNTSDECNLDCTGQLEPDGFIDYQLKLTARIPFKVKDIRLEIPVSVEKAGYIMGLGHEGGLRTSNCNWNWDVARKNQDMLWLGAVNGGLRIKWKAENYVRPLVNIYYEFGPLNLPPSWGNEGKGGIFVGQKGNAVIVNAYSGNREMKAGEILHYNFDLLITPFRVINRQNKFGDRYYHGGGKNTSVKIENARKAGANIINIHHAEDIYPFINYPYLDENSAELTQLVANAHKENMRMKFYYTTRELTKNLPEFWAFNSLNGEVIFPGPGNATRTEALHPKGPNEWLIKNVRENYIPAWYNIIREGRFKNEIDLSVVTTPDSRLNNFYIAGLDWMVQNMGIDGVYIDDSALDRYTLIRARKIIDQYRPEGRMDLHGWNSFNKWCGFSNILNVYMDLLPYFDLAWLGEGRDYDRAPDHWLIEISGIPFGLPGQMLQGGGNQWRGMVYGITTRAGYTGVPPLNIWKFWDEHKFSDKIMSGYWEPGFPVTSSNPLIKSSIYQGAGEVIIALANWSAQDEVTNLTLDWDKIGMNEAESDIVIPEIKDFQEGQNGVSFKKMTIPGKKGYLIVIKNK